MLVGKYEGKNLRLAWRIIEHNDALVGPSAPLQLTFTSYVPLDVSVFQQGSDLLRQILK